MDNQMPSQNFTEIEESVNIILKGLIGPKTTRLMQVVLDFWINSILSYFGVISNVLQLVVFFKLGYQDTINISMSFIASWDLARCILNVLNRLYAIVDEFSPAKAMSMYNISLLAFNYSSGIAGYVSGVLAAYVAVERCFCVTFPFTVRYLLTRKVVVIINAMISVVVCSLFFIIYASYEVFPMFHPQFNETILISQFNSFWREHPEIDAYLRMMYIMLIVAPFAIISLSSTIIAYQLKRATAFKKSSTGTAKDSKDAQSSSRERQVTKMLLVIVSIYIINGLPRILFFVLRTLIPEFNAGRRYTNMLWVALSIMNIFDFINAAVNIFIFYFMSSQFKAMFLKTVCRRKK